MCVYIHIYIPAPLDRLQIRLGGLNNCRAIGPTVEENSER